MDIAIGFDMTLAMTGPSLVLGALSVHPSVEPQLAAPETFTATPALTFTRYMDAFGNRIMHIPIPAGPQQLRLRSTALVRNSGAPDPESTDAIAHAVQDLPPEVLQFLLPSRYCDFDGALLDFAWQQFGQTAPGWGLVRSISDYVHQHIRFDYLQARATRSATEGWREGVGVCRDYAHLAVALCRCMNLPARYATGYLGDIGVPATPQPMDFSAWFQVYLGGQWRTWDARHNVPRKGRVLMACGRDAADVPITMVFGEHQLLHFEVTSKMV
ncbi:MAG: transglutaminase family protein [Comamonas sp.]